jgi:hypothetical protein
VCTSDELAAANLPDDDEAFFIHAASLQLPGRYAPHRHLCGHMLAVPKLLQPSISSLRMFIITCTSNSSGRQSNLRLNHK